MTAPDVAAALARLRTDLDHQTYSEPEDIATVLAHVALLTEAADVVSAALATAEARCLAAEARADRYKRVVVTAAYSSASPTIQDIARAALAEGSGES